MLFLSIYCLLQPIIQLQFPVLFSMCQWALIMIISCLTFNLIFSICFSISRLTFNALLRLQNSHFTLRLTLQKVLLSCCIDRTTTEIPSKLCPTLQKVGHFGIDQDKRQKIKDKWKETDVKWCWWEKTKDKSDADDILGRTKEGEEIQQEASPDLEEEVSKLMRLVANTSYFAVFTDFFILHLFTDAGGCWLHTCHSFYATQCLGWKFALTLCLFKSKEWLQYIFSCILDQNPELNQFHSWKPREGCWCWRDLCFVSLNQTMYCLCLAWLTTTITI